MRRNPIKALVEDARRLARVDSLSAEVRAQVGSSDAPSVQAGEVSAAGVVIGYGLTDVTTLGAPFYTAP